MKRKTGLIGVCEVRTSAILKGIDKHLGSNHTLPRTCVCGSAKNAAASSTAIWQASQKSLRARTPRCATACTMYCILVCKSVSMVRNEMPLPLSHRPSSAQVWVGSISRKIATNWLSAASACASQSATLSSCSSLHASWAVSCSCFCVVHVGNKQVVHVYTTPGTRALTTCSTLTCKSGSRACCRVVLTTSWHTGHMKSLRVLTGQMPTSLQVLLASKLVMRYSMTLGTRSVASVWHWIAMSPGNTVHTWVDGSWRMGVGENSGRVGGVVFVWCGVF